MQQPWVVLVTGAPGAGKSTTAAALARLLGAALLDQDTMTNPLVDVVASQVGVHDFDDPRLASLVRTPRYESLLAVARECVGVGVPAVLVAPFTSERSDPAVWEAMAARIHGWGARARLVWLRISGDELVARLSGRDATRDAAKLADPESWVRGLDLTAPVAPALAVDATLPAAEQARLVMQELQGDEHRHRSP